MVNDSTMAVIIYAISQLTAIILIWFIEEVKK